MFKKLLLILLTLLPVRGYSQSSADSLYFYEQANKNIALAQTNSNFLLNTDVARTGTSLFAYNNANGGFRKAQEAQITEKGGVRTEGISKFDRFITSGYFSFYRTWQDSLAWTTKGLEVDEQPYYYGSIKAGKYERFKYKLGGLASYNLIKNKLYIGTGLDYMYNSATRSVDPRPEVNTFHFTLKPEILYKWHSHTIGINALWGYGTEVTSITYKNDMYSTGSNNYIDRKAYLVQGYGFVTDNQGTDPLYRLNKNYGIGVSYSTYFNNYSLKTSFNYLSIWEDNYKDFSSSANKSYISFYDIEKLNYLLQIDKIQPKYEQQFTLQYNTQQAHDLNIIFYAINYKYNSNHFNLNYLFKHNQSPSFQKEFGVRFNYEGIQKDDLSTDHHIKYTSIEPALLANLYFKLKSKDRLKMGIDIAQRLPQEKFLYVPDNQIHVFTKGVVFPDYYYYNSKVLTTSINANYITANVFSKFKVGISANVSYYKANLPSETISTTTYYKPGNSFLSYNMSFNLYF